MSLRNDLPKGDEARGERRPDGPLDGSTSGTIGGGGPETGGATPRAEAPDMPRPDPENAASGRLAPDPLENEGFDDFGPGASDISER